MNLLVNRDLGLSTFNFMWKESRAYGLVSKSGFGVIYLYLHFLVTDSYIRASMTCTPCLRVDTASIAELLKAGCITGFIYIYKYICVCVCTVCVSPLDVH